MTSKSNKDPAYINYLNTLNQEEVTQIIFNPEEPEENRRAPLLRIFQDGMLLGSEPNTWRGAE